MKPGMGALVIELGKRKRSEPEHDDSDSDEHDAIYRFAEALGLKREDVDAEAAADALADWRACYETEGDDQ